MAIMTYFYPDTGSEPTSVTQPVQPASQLSSYQPIRLPVSRQGKSPVSGCVWLLIGFLGVVFLGCILIYLWTDSPKTILILGIDRPPEGTNTSRTDTIILARIDPKKPGVTLLSIPRDLWVTIPGVGENRINTAHFYAEANQSGSGPAATAETIQSNFAVKTDAYIRIRFDGFTRIVDALGGLTIDLPAPMGGYPAGQTHLNATQALAFARDRKGADDFFRMEHAQIIIKSLVNQMFSPLTWLHIPGALAVGWQAIDTNISIWEWPRIGVIILRAGSTGIESHTLPRTMTTPFITSGGADVLLPDWNQIRPFVARLFPPD
jgi:LCP family protein required for cell wall assembly